MKPTKVEWALRPCGLDKLRLYIDRSEPLTEYFRQLRGAAQLSGRSEDYRRFGLPLVLSEVSVSLHEIGVA
jgi:hypothetical protein